MSEDGMKQFKINKDWRTRLEASQNLKKEQARVARSIQSERDEVKRKLWKENFKNSENETQFSKTEQGLIMKSILDEMDVVNLKQTEAQVTQGPSKTMMTRVRNHIDMEILRNQKMNLLDPEQTKKHLLGRTYSDWAKEIDMKNDQYDPTAKFVKDTDPVKHPAHYTSGKIEVWDFIIDQKLDYCSGCAVKYIARAGRKDKDTHIQDLEKALAFLKRFLKQLQDAPESRYSEGQIEPLDFITDQGLSYCLGSAVEYICQFGGEVDYKENIQGAIRFVEQEIKYVKEKQNV